MSVLTEILDGDYKLIENLLPGDIEELVEHVRTMIEEDKLEFLTNIIDKYMDDDIEDGSLKTFLLNFRSELELISRRS